MIPPFFPRGSGPLMSVLIPSRGRSELLRKAMQSFVDLAEDKACFEFVLKLDDDDKASQKMVAESSFPIQKLVTPKGGGYRDLHLWVNQLAKIASGDWLWLFDDDATVTTQSWDKIFKELLPLRSYVGIRETAVFIPNNSEIGFPCIRRELVDLLGHISQDCICDRYVHLLCSVATKVMCGPCEVMHDTNNEVHSQPMDDDKSLVYNEENMHFLSLESRRHLVNDSNKLLSYLEDAEWNAVWTRNPTKEGWHLCDSGGGRFPVYVKESGECMTPTPIMEQAKWHRLDPQ